MYNYTSLLMLTIARFPEIYIPQWSYPSLSMVLTSRNLKFLNFKNTMKINPARYYCLLFAKKSINTHLFKLTGNIFFLFILLSFGCEKFQVNLTIVKMLGEIRQSMDSLRTYSEIHILLLYYSVIFKFKTYAQHEQYKNLDFK